FVVVSLLLIFTLSLSPVCGALIVCCFFFFQAEDGIRDATVTGVQTCALPISPLSFSRGEPRVDRFADDAKAEQGDVFVWISAHRSEERRVGKECRSRWSTNH